MTDFTKIKSRFVKNKLKKMKYNAKNKKHIEDLMKIEHFALDPGRNWNGLQLYGFHPKYDKNATAIFMELNPKVYKMLLEQHRIQRENVKRWKKEVKEQEEMEKEISKHTWELMKRKKAAGGKK